MIKAEKGCDIMMVLASNSPRRKELLRLICPSFEIEPADVDERVEENLPLDRIPAYLARKKAAHNVCTFAAENETETIQQTELWNMIN